MQSQIDYSFLSFWQIMETQEDSCKLNQWDILPLPSLGRIYSARFISLHLDQIAACEELYP